MTAAEQEADRFVLFRNLRAEWTSLFYWGNSLRENAESYYPSDETVRSAAATDTAEKMAEMRRIKGNGVHAVTRGLAREAKSVLMWGAPRVRARDNQHL